MRTMENPAYSVRTSDVWFSALGLLIAVIQYVLSAPVTPASYYPTPSSKLTGRGIHI
jgi:hypothetical protein